MIYTGGGHPQGVPLRAACGRLPDVVGDVVFGAEVEDVGFVLVFVFVGVEGVDAYSVYGWEIVDFDALAGERVVASEEGDLFTVRIQFG